MALAYAVQEARLLMQLRHPNIVHAKDFFTEGEDHCIVLAYCGSGDLKQQIDAAANARRALEPTSILGWMAGIASAAKHFHREGVIHRDLKPANVFLTALDGRPGDVRVGDFGSARQLHTGEGSIRAKLTGTKHYMVISPTRTLRQPKAICRGELTAHMRDVQAPEVHNEQPYDQRADVWSMGVIFLHLLTLRLPNSQALFRGNIPDLVHLERTHGADSCSCMRSMLQVEAPRRPSPEQILLELREASARRGEFFAGDGGIRPGGQTQTQTSDISGMPDSTEAAHLTSKDDQDDGEIIIARWSATTFS
jgi:serine/threonine protein kinase